MNIKIYMGSSELVTLPFNAGPYRAFSEEPDLCLVPANNFFSSIAFETGWVNRESKDEDEDESEIESPPYLRNDLPLWLNGTADAVKAVILLIWRGTTDKTGTVRVSGDIEMYIPDQSGGGILILSQKEVIFPEPSEPRIARGQRINLTRGQVFGGGLLPGRDGADILRLSVDTLRLKARGALLWLWVDETED
ncbi:hypothetical protein BDV19DRAFT_389149 [Aspergillus venezuelensis]